jgi:hypothetical protein
MWHHSLSQPAPGFENLQEGAALNKKQENALPDTSGDFEKQLKRKPLVC